MANTMTLISSYTVGSGGASSIDFTSIPSTFTDLVLKISVRSDRAASTWDNTQLKVNNSTANMTNRYLSGNGSSAGSGTLTVSYIGDIPATGATSSTFANQEIYITNYAGSTNKSMSVDSVAETNGSTAYAYFDANLWSQTTAINQLTVFSGNAANFVQYSTAYLYGVKNA
jgi:hypothetical protein